MEEHADRVATLRQNELFQTLSEEELHSLAPLMRKVQVKPGEFILHEGEYTSDLFLIAEGEVQVLKREPAQERLHEITRLGGGASIGELALLDAAPRSASVRAILPTRLYALSPADIRSVSGGKTVHSEVVARLSAELARRLRYTNEVTVKSLRLQVAMGTFLTFIIFSLSLYAFALNSVAYYASVVASTTLVTVALMSVLVIAALVVMTRLGYPMSFYGLTLANWKRSAAEALLYTAPLCALIVGVKWLLISTVPALSGKPLFDPEAAIRAAPDLPLAPATLVAVMALFYMLHAPLQEFIVRGGLQSSLDHFLTGRHHAAVAILGSNLIFSAFHLYISTDFALVTFLAGLFWGWLYARQRTLVGVGLSHVIIGLWAVFVVGIEGVL